MSSTLHDIPAHERSASTQSAASEVLNKATEVSSPPSSSETGLCSTCSTSPAVQAFIEEEALQAADQVIAEDQDRVRMLADTWERMFQDESADADQLRDEVQTLKREVETLEQKVETLKREVADWESAEMVMNSAQREHVNAMGRAVRAMASAQRTETGRQRANHLRQTFKALRRSLTESTEEVATQVANANPPLFRDWRPHSGSA